MVPFLFALCVIFTVGKLHIYLEEIWNNIQVPLNEKRNEKIVILCITVHLYCVLNII